jgi:ceramide glucosyltransferase
VNVEILGWILAALLAGSLVYCVLILLACRSYLQQQTPRTERLAPVSVLKPLAGVDEGLEANLRSFFEQDHQAGFELLFAVRAEDDAAVPVVKRLQERYPGVLSRLIVTGEPPYPNAKVYSLEHMLADARHDLLVMSDSDIRVKPGFLRSIAAEFSDPRIALATCPYRAVAGRSLWSMLEAEGMNTEFLAGVLVARWMQGVKFAVGPTIAVRKHALRAIGGFSKLKDYLAEDYVMGREAASAGLGVILSRTTVEHRIGSESLAANATHRLRWARSARRSRPAGYLGMLFTHPLTLSLALIAVDWHWWPSWIVASLFRIAAAWATSKWVLGVQPQWLLLPIQDFLSFGFWVAGFFGNTIVWRGRRYYLYPDGRFELHT